MLTLPVTPRAGGTRTAASARVAGFTLVELVIALVLASLVAGATVTLMLRQQRFYNSTTELIQTRQQIRQAAAMLPSDLRGISSGGGDIYAMTDSSLEFRAVFGSSIVCVNTGGKLSTVPRVLARGSAMTNWARQPAPGDSVLVYNDSSALGATDDAWSRYQISVVTPVPGNVANGCPTSSNLVQLGDLTTGNPSFQLTFVAAASSRIRQGAAIRFFRRGHYSHYKGPDSRWYLGYYDCVPNRAPVCNNSPMNAIAGPFQPYATNGTSGLQFAYYDSTGAVTTNRNLVARISLVVRGQGAAPLNLTGAGASVFRDSLRIEVGLRNRR
jgi:prepilin-type N-terminal cleavage/methylation domain-containing protein